MARIGDLLATRPTLSFEFFPPKTDEAERALDKAVAELAELRPSFVSVTYGAGGSTRERTRDLVVRINREQAFPAMAHLTCMGHTRADIQSLLDEYAESGVENLLALGGDPPTDGSGPVADLHYATDLVEFVRAIGRLLHRRGRPPRAAPPLHHRAEDRRLLAAKLELADFGVTQFFFEIDPTCAWWTSSPSSAATSPSCPGSCR